MKFEEQFPNLEKKVMETLMKKKTYLESKITKIGEKNE